MLTSLSIAAAGLRHAAVRQVAAAHNTASAVARKGAELRVVGQEAAGGQGVRTTVEARRQTGPVAVAAVEVAVEQIASRRAAEASVAAVRTADDLLGTLIDLAG